MNAVHSSLRFRVLCLGGIAIILIAVGYAWISSGKRGAAMLDRYFKQYGGIVVSRADIVPDPVSKRPRMLQFEAIAFLSPKDRRPDDGLIVLPEDPWLLDQFKLAAMAEANPNGLRPAFAIMSSDVNVAVLHGGVVSSSSHYKIVYLCGSSVK